MLYFCPRFCPRKLDPHPLKQAPLFSKCLPPIYFINLLDLNTIHM